ncbi:hypothetical protein [Halobacillus trueperi]|uniref:Uncharacterized protein n=1 Tax=Halobacillus trueperi TaxID=156205 RepID=A0A3E0JDE4_9BACI|nr:hypothetical protein [Halobacillus trueperi]REJ10941.1 hypothetical protein DYE48_00625 [Halobacillus trueperi]
MNKKEGLVISLILLSFASLFIWYSSGSKSLTGQSKSWSGHYVGDEENGTMFRELILTYTGDSVIDAPPVTYTVDTESTWGGKEIHWKGTKRLSGQQLYLESKCNDCRIALKSEMTVTLEWEGKKEKLVLSK